MSGSIRLHKKHGVAPVLMFCRICGKDTNGIALLGAGADRVMNEIQKATGSKVEGYKEYGHNRIPDDNPCEECKAHLDSGGAIFIAEDTGEYLKLEAEVINELEYIPAGKKGAIDLKACTGKILTLPKAFWTVDGSAVKLRDPREWAE